MEIINNYLFTENYIIGLTDILYIKKSTRPDGGVEITYKNQNTGPYFFDIEYSQLLQYYKERCLKQQNKNTHHEFNEIKNKLKL